MRQKYYKQQHIANADSVNNLIRLEHIISACPVLAKEQYIKRHDRVCAQLHFNIRREIRVKLENKHWYDHVPKSVEQVMKVRLPHYGTNKSERTELYIPINRTSQYMITRKEHAR
jgi:hypothetical protein